MSDETDEEDRALRRRFVEHKESFFHYVKFDQSTIVERIQLPYQSDIFELV